MSVKPVLFNTAMVKEILAARKTQTRRLLKGLPMTEPYATEEDGKLMISDENGEWFPAEGYSRIQPGDVLWVRETWAKVAGRYMYRANYSDTEKFYMCGREIRMTWHPSIHMPKDAARLFLNVKKVRVERLQDMSPEDCANDGGFEMEAIKAVGIASLFGSLWNSTLKKKALKKYGWDANPWVYVYEFERTDKNPFK